MDTLTYSAMYKNCNVLSWQIALLNVQILDRPAPCLKMPSVPMERSAAVVNVIQG